jgi:hypothetical protein
MAEHRWQPTERTRSSWALSNGSDPKRWLLTGIYRWYVEAAAREFQRLITFLVWFDPPPLFDHAIVLATVARFPVPVRYESLLEQWKDDKPVCEALAEQSSLTALTPEQFRTFLPSASHVTGMVVPLCRLTSTDVVRSQCVEPMLEAMRTLGQ